MCGAAITEQYVPKWRGFISRCNEGTGKKNPHQYRRGNINVNGAGYLPATRFILKLISSLIRSSFMPS